VIGCPPQAVDAQSAGTGRKEHDEAADNADILLKIDPLCDTGGAGELPIAVRNRRRRDHEDDHQLSARTGREAESDGEAAEELNAGSEGGKIAERGTPLLARLAANPSSAISFSKPLLMKIDAITSRPSSNSVS
jgi:hypothetical protein